MGVYAARNVVLPRVELVSQQHASYSSVVRITRGLGDSSRGILSMWSGIWSVWLLDAVSGLRRSVVLVSACLAWSEITSSFFHDVKLATQICKGVEFAVQSFRSALLPPGSCNVEAPAFCLQQRHAESCYHPGVLGMALLLAPDLELARSVLGHQSASREDEGDEATIGEGSDLHGMSADLGEVFE